MWYSDTHSIYATAYTRLIKPWAHTKQLKPKKMITEGKTRGELSFTPSESPLRPHSNPPNSACNRINATSATAQVMRRLPLRGRPREATNAETSEVWWGMGKMRDERRCFSRNIHCCPENPEKGIYLLQKVLIRLLPRTSSIKSRYTPHCERGSCLCRRARGPPSFDGLVLGRGSAAQAAQGIKV